MKTHLSLAFVIAAALTASAAEMTVCPPWELSVVDSAGKPVAGCSVLQLWGCDFREGFVGKKADALTDKDGRVTFPARTVESPSASTWKKALRRLDGKGSPDPTASVYVSHPGHRSVWIQSRRDSQVVATRDGLRTRVVLEVEKP